MKLSKKGLAVETAAKIAACILIGGLILGGTIYILNKLKVGWWDLWKTIKRMIPGGGFL